MMFTLRILPFLLALFAPLACLAQSTADLATMKDRVREDDRASVGASAALVAEWKNSLQANGSWADINYADKSRTAWNPLNHLVRLVGMAVAYQTPGTAEFASAAVRQGISNGVNYWYASNPTSDNWWFNDIGAPRQLGYLLLQMQNELTATQISTGASKMAAGPARTGQNRVWISSIAIYRGLLENNISRVSSGMDGVKETVIVTTAEGIQPDYSFHQHGAQLYSGGYGHGLLNDVVRWVFMGASTGFQFPADKVEIMADYILEGSGWMLRHELMDYSTIGREISRRGTSLKGLGLSKTFERMESLGGPDAPLFQSLVDHVQGSGTGFIGNRHFWRSDFIVHRRPAFYASVKMSSTRTIGAESINNENLKGIYLPFGSQLIYRRGDEYNDIFPVWNWLRVPGTTVEQTATVPSFAGNLKGTTAFVGGVSSGGNGLASMELNFRNVQGRKSWFFFDEGFLALGAGLTCSGGDPVYTTINQTRLSGPVFSGSDGNTNESVQGERNLANTSWVHHDGVGYLLPSRPSLHLKNKAQSGSWNSINTQYPYEPETMDVFTLGINHGTAPAAAGYEYAVLPGTTPAEVAAYAAGSPLTVLANTTALQAARHQLQQLTAASFHQSGKLDLRPGLQVAVNQPCLMLFKENGSSYEISVSNPLNAPLTVRMTVSARFAAHPDAAWMPTQKMSEIVFQLSGGSAAGSTMTKNLTLTGEPPSHLPSAAFIASALEGYAPWSIDFDANASAASGTATLTSYHWDFGDGTTSYSPVASHSYGNPGIYQATLTVTDSRGATDTASAVIRIRSSLPAAADSYVRGGIYGNDNYGSATTLHVKQGAENEFTRRPYLKFDLSGYPGSISRAILRFVVTEIEATATSAEFSVYHVPGDTWGESTLTWNNRPARTAVPRATAQGSYPGQIVDVDLTSTVNQELSGDKILSLQIAQVSGNVFLSLGSREHATAAPQLLIEGSAGSVVASAGPGGSIVLPQSSYSLGGSVSGGGQTKVLWSQQSGPAAVSFTAPSNPASQVIFSRAGTYVLRLDASDGMSFSHSDVTVTVYPQTLASWSEHWFGGPTDLSLDSDGDGLSDALEFALGGNPTAADGARLQPQMHLSGEGTERQLTLHYAKASEETNYSVEWSATLANDWSISGVSPERFDQDRGTYSRSIAAPPGQQPLFLRLRVNLP